MFTAFSTVTKITMQTAIALGVIWTVGKFRRVADIPFRTV
jgi:hypothetical protein